MRRHRSALAVLAITGCLLAPAAPALAHGGQAQTDYTQVATGFAGPLHLAFGKNGRLYVADAFAGAIVKVDIRNGATWTLAKNPAYFLPGVGVQDDKVYAVGTKGGGDPSAQGPTALFRVSADGKLKPVADLLRHELKRNPDGQPQTGYPEPDAISNPYAVLPLKRFTLVADAAGNDILKVSRHGKVSTLTKLPVSRKGECATATNNGVANGGCDPTPTDLKLGRDGYLYVSGLGGEAEGHIWKIHLRSGKIVKHWGGFPPLTGIALDGSGNIYASSLFTNQIFKVAGNGARTAADVPGPTGLAWYNGRLYAGSADLEGGGPGSVVVLKPGAFAPLV
jgi:hypothetical protein